MSDLLDSLLGGPTQTLASLSPSPSNSGTSSSASRTSAQTKSLATASASNGSTLSSTESGQKTQTKASASSHPVLTGTSPVHSSSMIPAPAPRLPPQNPLSSLANQDNGQTSDEVTGTSSETTSISSPASTALSKEASSASSQLPITQPIPSTTFATSVSSSIVPPSPSTSDIPSIETAAATGGNPPPNITSGSDGNKVPVAGIVVASVVGVMALIGIFFLIFRYCKPLRRRYDAWQEQKRLARTYRSAIDEPELKSEKLDNDSSPQVGPYTGHRFYSQTPQTPTDRVGGGQNTGLGLGSRLSLLRQHSPFQTAEQGPQRTYAPNAPYAPAASGAQYSRDLPPLPR